MCAVISALRHGLSQALQYVGSVCARVAFRAQALLCASQLLLQWLLEDVVHIIGADMLALALVMLALVSQNALAFGYLAAAGCGVFMQQRCHRRLPLIVTAALAGVATAQYALLLVRHNRSSCTGWQVWLGLCPTHTEVALQLFVHSLAAACAHCNAWRRHSAAADMQAADGNASTDDESSLLQPLLQSAPAAARGGASSNAVVSEGQQHLYRLIQQLPYKRHTHAILLRQSSAHMVQLSHGEQMSSSQLRPAASSNGGREAGRDGIMLWCMHKWAICGNMPVHERARWSWPDHLRFWLLRFSLDVLMIFIVALSCAQVLPLAPACTHRCVLCALKLC